MSKSAAKQKLEAMPNKDEWSSIDFILFPADRPMRLPGSPSATSLSSNSKRKASKYVIEYSRHEKMFRVWFYAPSKPRAYELIPLHQVSKLVPFQNGAKVVIPGQPRD